MYDFRPIPPLPGDAGISRDSGGPGDPGDPGNPGSSGASSVSGGRPGASGPKSRRLRPPSLLLRASLLMDAVVFLTAALLNFGLHIPLGFMDLGFPVAIWQAGIGEFVVGAALLAAAASGRASVNWSAWGLSVAGIAFGLASSKVQGPAHDVHLVLVPIAFVVFGLLAWQWLTSRGQGSSGQDRRPNDGTRSQAASAFRGGDSDGGPGARRPFSVAVPRRPISVAIPGLMLIAAATFAIASIVHFGVVLTVGPLTLDDPFSGAAIPEAIIAIALAAGAAWVIARRPSSWWAAAAATTFAGLATLYGLSITLRSSRTGDVDYHLAVLALLVVILGLLLLRLGRRSLSRG